MSYNKFKSTEFKDVNSLGYAIKSIGNIICDSSIKTDNIQSKSDNTNVKIKNCLNIDCGNAGAAINLAAGDSSTDPSTLYGKILWKSFSTGMAFFGDSQNERFDFFRNMFIHGNLTIDANFYLNTILYCNSISSQANQDLTLNSNDGRNILISYYKPSGGKVIINRSCTATTSSVDIEQGNLNMKNDAVTTIYCNQIKDYSNVSFLKSSILNSSLNTNGIINTGNIKNSNHLLMKADGAQSIYFTIDGNTLSSNNCVGRLFGATNQMYFDYYNNCLFRDSTLADAVNNNTLNISLSNSTFYGPLTTNNITNNGTLNRIGAASFNSLSSTSIPNTGSLSTGNIEISSVSPAYIDLKTTAGNGDYDCRISCTTRLVGTAGKGNLSFYCLTTTINSPLIVSGIKNSSVLSQNGVANINNNLNVTGVANLKNLELGPNGSDFTYIDMKATGGNSDYDARIGVNSPASGSDPGQGALTINCGSCSMNSNLTTTGNISCNTINAAIYNVGSTNYAGPLYMSNASPIYLKSTTDFNHYIKYDSVYDGPQLGFFTGLSIKCTDNNAIILNTSKTNININVDTNVNSNCIISNQCTVQNGLVSENFNQSNYYTFKGSTWNVTFSTSYSYTNFDGSHGSFLSESLQIPSNCKTIKITYSYNTTYPNNVFQGASEYVIYVEYYSGIATVWQVGSTNYTPIITCSSTGLLYIEFPKNTNLTGHCYWSFGILMI